MGDRDGSAIDVGDWDVLNNEIDCTVVLYCMEDSLWGVITRKYYMEFSSINSLARVARRGTNVEYYRSIDPYPDTTVISTIPRLSAPTVVI